MDRQCPLLTTTAVCTGKRSYNIAEINVTLKRIRSGPLIDQLFFFRQMNEFRPRNRLSKLFGWYCPANNLVAVLLHLRSIVPLTIRAACAAQPFFAVRFVSFHVVTAISTAKKQIWIALSMVFKINNYWVKNVKPFARSKHDLITAIVSESLKFYIRVKINLCNNGIIPNQCCTHLVKFLW